MAQGSLIKKRTTVDAVKEYVAVADNDSVLFLPRPLFLGNPLTQNTIVWDGTVAVVGKRDKECADLLFGFVQYLTRLEAEWAWEDPKVGKPSRRCEAVRAPRTPWWDKRNTAPDQSFWYDPSRLGQVKACFNESKGEAAGTVPLHFADQPGPKALEWIDPKNPKGQLVSVDFGAQFVVTLVEQSAKKFRSLAYVRWSVFFKASFDFLQAPRSRTKFLFNVVDAKPVVMGGDTEAKLREIHSNTPKPGVPPESPC